MDDELERKRALLQRKRELEASGAATPAQTAPTDIQMAPPEIAPQGTRWERFKTGLGTSALESGLGIKDLAQDGGLSDEDKNVLKIANEDVDAAGGWGLGGQVTGDIMQLAVPAGTIARIFGKEGKLKKALEAKGVNTATAKRAAGAANLTGQTALGAGYGAMQAPEEDSSRTEGAIMGGAGSVLGSGIGKVLSKAVNGIKQTPWAEHLNKMGVRLSPGQASEPGIARSLEYIAGVTPLLARSVQKMKDVSLNTFNKAILNEAAAPGKKVNSIGHEGLQELKQGYEQAYKDAWDKAGTLDDAQLVALITKADDALKLTAEAKGPVAKISESLLRYIDDRSTQNLHALDDRIRIERRKLEEAKFPNRELIDSLSEIKETLINSASQETREALKAINGQYGKYKTVQNAAASTSGMFGGKGLEGGVFTGQDLGNAVKNVSAVGPRAEGTAPLQTEAKAAMETLSRKDPVPFMNDLRGVVKNWQIPGLQEFTVDPLVFGVSNAAMGRTATQRGAKIMAEYLRKGGVTEENIGQAVTTNKLPLFLQYNPQPEQ